MEKIRRSIIKEEKNRNKRRRKRWRGKQESKRNRRRKRFKRRIITKSLLHGNINVMSYEFNQNPFSPTTSEVLGY